MTLLQHLRLSVRMALAFGSVLLLLGSIVAVATLRFESVGDATDRRVDEDWTKAEAVAVFRLSGAAA